MTDARDALADALGEWAGVPGDIGQRDAADFRAILARHGLAVVPIKPTEAMLGAACNTGGGYRGKYRAMLAAAQEPQR